MTVYVLTPEGENAHLETDILALVHEMKGEYRDWQVKALDRGQWVNGQRAEEACVALDALVERLTREV